MASGTAIGIMDGAFFVGRKEILDWINSTLGINLGKIEDTASGAVACQLLDIMHPGVVPMAKVNWSAKQSFEFVANYKILQTAFAKVNIDKHVDVDRLIASRYMDNLEFMQWFKRFFEMKVQDIGDYDAKAQRTKGKGGATYGLKSGSSASAVSKPAASVTSSSSVPAPKNPTSTSSGTSKVAAVRASPAKKSPTAVSAPKETKSAGSKPAASKVTASSTANKSTGGRAVSAPAPPSADTTTMPPLVSASSLEVEALRAELEEMRQANEESNRSYTDLRLEMEGLEKERDFYFEKLREVEILLQDIEESDGPSETTTSILKILYATADGFEVSDGAVDGNIENPETDEVINEEDREGGDDDLTF